MVMVLTSDSTITMAHVQKKDSANVVLLQFLYVSLLAHLSMTNRPRVQWSFADLLRSVS